MLVSPSVFPCGLSRVRFWECWLEQEWRSNRLKPSILTAQAARLLICKLDYGLLNVPLDSILQDRLLPADLVQAGPASSKLFTVGGFRVSASQYTQVSSSYRRAQA